MSGVNTERIGALQSLLARVQKNAAAPRSTAVAPPKATGITREMASVDERPAQVAVPPSPVVAQAVVQAPLPVVQAVVQAPVVQARPAEVTPVIAQATKPEARLESPKPPPAEPARLPTLRPIAADSPTPPSAMRKTTPPASVEVLSPPPAAVEIDTAREPELIEEGEPELEELGEADVISAPIPPPELPAPPVAPPTPAKPGPRRSDSIEMALQAAVKAVPSTVESLEADVLPHVAEPPPAGPSAAQLGAIIELEEGGPIAPIELAVSMPAAAAAPPEDEEEVLPAASPPGLFHAGPPSAREVALAADGAQKGTQPGPTPPAPPLEQARPVALAFAIPESPKPAPLPEVLEAPVPARIEVSASTVTRATTVSDSAAVFIEAARRPTPATFGELLDDALSL